MGANNKPYPPEEVEMMLRLAEEGKTIKEISLITKRCAKGVASALKKKGFVPLTSGQRKLRKLQSNKDTIIKMYQSGASVTQIRKRLHHGQKEINRILTEANVQMRRGVNSAFYFDDKELDTCIKLYCQGKTLKYICRERHHNLKALHKAFVARGIDIRDRLYYTACKVDETYFDVIDTQEKAYFLGLLFADGSVCKQDERMHLTLKADDGYLIEAFKKATKCSNKILDVKSKDRRDSGFGISKPQKELSFVNKHMAQILLNYGMERKDRFPEAIPLKLQHHFIRGMFDGDGCIWNGHRSPSEGLFYILANKDMCYTVKEILEANGCINMEIKPRKNIWQTRKNSNKVCMLNAYKYLYKDATIFMSRKHEIWKEWLKDNEFYSSSLSHELQFS